MPDESDVAPVRVRRAAAAAPLSARTSSGPEVADPGVADRTGAVFPAGVVSWGTFVHFGQ